MTVEHRCLECTHSRRDPNATVEQRLTGAVAHLCVAAPPVMTPVPVNGGIALTTMYPLVGERTISCALFQPATKETTQ